MGKIQRKNDLRAFFYQARPNREGEGAQFEILSYLKPQLSSSMSDSFSAPLLESDLKKALFNMKLGKSSGPDRNVCKFYRLYWGYIRIWLVAIEPRWSKKALP